MSNAQSNGLPHVFIGYGNSDGGAADTTEHPSVPPFASGKVRPIRRRGARFASPFEAVYLPLEVFDLIEEMAYHLLLLRHEEKQIFFAQRG